VGGVAENCVLGLGCCEGGRVGIDNKEKGSGVINKKDIASDTVWVARWGKLRDKPTMILGWQGGNR
jgi:hypothetical protein